MTQSDTDQTNLFETPRSAMPLGVAEEQGRARHTDPETSKVAAKSVRATSLEIRVVQVIACCPLGATCGEIVDMTGLAWNTVSPRLKPLREKGLIEVRRDGEGKKITRTGKPSGRAQLVWVIKE